MNMSSKREFFKIGMAVCALGLAYVALLGCGSPSSSPASSSVGNSANATTPSAAVGTTTSTAIADLPKGVPGLPVDVSSDPKDGIIEIAKSRTFARRTDPFALLAEERKFDKDQATARFISEAGSFSLFYEEPPEEVVEEIIEPTPAWRLSAVMIGDGVSAILVQHETEGILIRPGQRIEGTEWVVASIDEDRAILRRKGHRKPKQFEVRLMGSASGSTGNTGRAGSPGTGNTPGRPGGGGGKPSVGGATGGGGGAATGA